MRLVMLNEAKKVHAARVASAKATLWICGTYLTFGGVW